MGAPLNLRDWLWPELGASRQPAIARRLRDEFRASDVMSWLADDPLITLDGRAVTPTGTKRQNGLYGPSIGFFSTLGQGSTDRLTTPLVTTPEKITVVLRYMQRSSAGDDYRLFDKGDGFHLGGSSPSVNYYNRPFSVSGGQWRFATPGYGEYATIAIAHDASSASNTPLIAINGVLLSLALTATPSGTATTGGTNFILGNRSSGDRGIDGLIEFCVVLDRCLDRDQLLEASIDPMQLFEVGHDVFVGAASGGTSYDLTIAEATHGHTADALTLYADLGLTIDDAAHGHTADAVALSAEHALNIAEATHGHTVDLVALNSSSVLSISEAAHGHTADSPILDVVAALSIADATHEHTADTLALVTNVSLVIDEATHSHTADVVACSVNVFLSIQDATHGHTADAVVVDTNATLSIAEATHGHTADALALSVAVVLVVDDATHGLTSDAVAISANYILSIAEAVHAHTADVVNITISGAPTLTPEDIAAIADAVWNHPKALTLARFIALK